MANPRKFYDLPVWRKLRRAVLIRDGAICQNCGCSVIDKKWVADHIVQRPRGVIKFLPHYDCLKNLQVLCFKCHNRKTFQDDLNTREQIGPDGFPIGSDWS